MKNRNEFKITFNVGSHPIIVNALMNMKLKAIADQDNTIECIAMDNLKLLIEVYNYYVIGQHRTIEFVFRIDFEILFI